jgi:cell division septation protein DedD
MPTMVTLQAGRIALLGLLLSLAAGCSREQQDWHSAQSADTTEGWQRFIEQHPDSELAAQARAHIAQMADQSDFTRADAVGTVEAYRRFLAQHPKSRWAEQARIRIEAFSLGSAPRIAPDSTGDVALMPEARGVRALQLASGTPARQEAAAPVAATPAQDGLAQPGEAAVPAAAPDADDAATPAQSPPIGYAVQLGAFGSAASADREWQRLQGRFGTQLGGLAPRIVLASTDFGQLYRLQASAGGEAQARAICDSLKEQSQACVPVVPR